MFKIGFVATTVVALLCGICTPAKAQTAQSTSLVYECSLSGRAANGLSACPTVNPILSATVSGLAGTEVSQLAVIGNTNAAGIACNAATLCGASASGTAALPIDAWGTCRWIDDHNTGSVFVPFRTSIEWTSFLNAAPGSSVLNYPPPHCARPDPAYNVANATPTISVTPPYAGCTSASVPTVPVYGRSGSSYWPSPIPAAPSVFRPNFTCHGGATAIQSLLNWSAGDPSWTPNFLFSPDLTLTANGASPSATITSGGSATLAWSTNPSAVTCSAATATVGNTSTTLALPTPTSDGSFSVSPTATTTYTFNCTGGNGLISTASVQVIVVSVVCSDGATFVDGVCASVNGACGSANGTSVGSAPTANLCSTGTASAVSGSGPWTWTCAGSDGGTSASCSTPAVCTGGSVMPADFVILLDASASMGQLDSNALAALNNIVGTYLAPYPQVRLAINVLGGANWGPVQYAGSIAPYTNPDGAGYYGNVIPLGQANAAAVRAALTPIVATASTPLAEAIAYSAQFFDDPTRTRVLMVLSDGWETTQDVISPAASIANARNAGIQVYGLWYQDDGGGSFPASSVFTAMNAYATGQDLMSIQNAIQSIVDNNVIKPCGSPPPN